MEKKRMLGTNPICVAFPMKNDNPIVIDLATSAAANGKLEIAERNAKPIPSGWLVNKDGESTTNPADLKNGGALLPLGSTVENGSHKGYGLGAMVDILCGVLTGASFGPWVPPFVSFLPLITPQPGDGLGHFVGAMRVDAFRPIDAYFEAINIWKSSFKATEPINMNEPVLIHGEIEQKIYEERLQNGIPLNEKVYEDILSISLKFGIDLKI